MITQLGLVALLSRLRVARIGSELLQLQPCVGVREGTSTVVDRGC